MKSRTLWILVAIILAGSISLFGQSEPNLETGFKPYGSYHGSDIDSVNVMNGNLTLHIPYPYSYPQRGGKLDNKGYIVMNGKTWTTAVRVIPPSEGGGSVTFWTAGNAQLIDNLYGGYASETLLAVVTRNVATVTANGTTISTATNYAVRTWDGASHPLVDVSGNGTAFEAFDASGWRISLVPGTTSTPPQTGVIIDRNGTQYVITRFNNNSFGGCNPSPIITPPSGGGGHPPIIPLPGGSQSFCGEASVTGNITDANGNIYALPASASAAGTDTMGRALSFMGLPPGAVVGSTTDSSGCSTSLPFAGANLISYPGPNGVSHQLKFCYGTLAAQTNFGISGITEFPASAIDGGKGPAGPSITTVILPDGSTWNITYDNYGNVVSLALPLGGSISYQYGAVAFPRFGTSAPPISRTVVQRTLVDNNGNSYVWKYQWMTAQSNPTGANGTYTNVVTDPLGNDTVHVFTNLSGNLYETRTQSYQNLYTSGQLLKQVDTTYQTTQGAQSSTALPLTIQTTMFPSGRVSLVQKSYDSGITPTNGNCTLCSPTVSFGKVLTEKEYDWGQGAPGALLRETDTTYEWQTNSAYLSAHMIDLPASVVVKNGSGCALSEADYVYDESAYLTAANVSLQHGGIPASVRGNATSITKWLAPASSCNPKGGTPIIAHTNWYDTGEVFQQIDPLGHTTSHGYDPAYVGAFSTQTCNALSQCVAGTYDFTTGLLTSFTNANATQQAIGTTPGDSAHTTSYAYDLMSRISSATLPPDPGNGGTAATTQFNYPVPVTLPFTVTRTKSITPALTDSSTTTFDGLSRVYKTQHVLPNGTAEIDTSYDGLDHDSSVTNPFFSTSDSTYGVTQTQYDALGRPKTVIEQDGSVKTVAYSQGTCASGDDTTTADETGKQRRTCSDGLGRLIEVDEPGGSFPGTQASGSSSVSGTLQSKVVGATNPAAGTGSLTITGAEGSVTIGGGSYCAMWNNDGDCVDWEINPPTTIYDSGTVTITVNGHADSVSYGSASTANSIASGLASAINGDGSAFVTASATNGVLSLTARTTGASTNYSWSLSHSSSDSADFGAAGSFSSSPASGALTGGANGSGGTTVYDAGTVAVMIGTFTASASYGQSGNSTAAAVALTLAGSGSTGLSRAGSPVTASASGSSITITYGTPGTVGNITFSCSSSTSQGTNFSSPSFTCPASNNLTGGVNPGGISLDHDYFVTQYAYDSLDNLTTVTQKGDPAVTNSSQWRVRTFTYDSLSRLLTANNPESGTISYIYDAAGNLLQKTSPAANQTGSATTTISFCYDALNRVTGKAYSAQACPLTTPVVTYTYDVGTNGIGHLTSLTDQAGSATYSYDVLGRVSSEQRTIAGVSKSLGYTYNLDGSIATVTYPSGQVITYTPDSAARMVSAVGVNTVSSGCPPGVDTCPVTTNYVIGATYGPDSAITGFTSGNSPGFAGITNSFSYNKRLQPVNMSASSSSQTVFSIGYDFHVGNGTSGADNGNVWGITNYKDTTRNQSFTYDALNRLTSAQNAGTDCAQTVLQSKTKFWGNSYSYDAWGNLLSKSITKCGAENLSLTADNQNRAHSTSGADYQYDAAGNMTFNATPPSATYTYDQENRITGAGGYTYTYDADGNRVKKANGSAGMLYWYMTLGIVGESDLSGNLTAEYVFFGGERVARKDFPGGAVSYYFSDHLKTASVITDSLGSIKSESDYYPWGGELQFTNTDSNHYKFTGKERDTETGLDYFGARYYSNGLGRFITPDWAAKATAVPYAEFADPQSLNLYTYVRNIPTTRVDADGHCMGDDCAKISVTAEVTKQPEMTHDPNAGNAAAVGQVKYTITYDGKPMANTPVHEDVSNKLTKNGKPEPAQTKTADAPTDANGQVPDTTAIGVHADGFSGSITAENTLSTNVYEKKTTQTLTINSPEGYACKIKETRKMTNADKNGKPSGQYHVKVNSKPQNGTAPPSKPHPPSGKTKKQD